MNLMPFVFFTNVHIILYQLLRIKKLAEEGLLENKKVFHSTPFKCYSFSEFQIVFSHSIKANRIIKVITYKNDSGRTTKLKRKYEAQNDTD
ncbi:MAG: hypothetical protein EAZ27_06735 [Cytophagales bacterium]|nr:MAG: hypothetical protein EAZ27_06735 [Cytophagales bacterium]